jgi:hypothetical protein
MKNFMTSNNMKKLLLILGFIFSVGAFAQQKNQALHIIFQNVDTTYFDEGGTRWQEFSLLPSRAFKVNDLLEADTTLKECFVIKGNKNYIKYVKENYPEIKISKNDRKIYGHLDCECGNYIILMWMYPDYAFGMVATQSME